MLENNIKDLIINYKNMTKKEFEKIITWDNPWNKIIKLNNLLIATVRWHNNPWKIVNTTNFNDLTEWKGIIKEFRTRDLLWKYIKQNNLIN